MDAPDRGKKHCHRVLCNGVGRIGGDAQDMDPSEGVLDVNVIKACTAERNDPRTEGYEAVDHGGVYRIVDEHANGVVPLCKLCGILRKLGFKIFDLKARRPSARVKGFYVVGLSIKECDFQLGSPCSNFFLVCARRSVLYEAPLKTGTVRVRRFGGFL